jgi:ABC-2 type transport system permease protein
LLAVLKDPRGRFTLLVPPISLTLIYGYVAMYNLNDVPYAVLDLDRSNASRELLARVEGSRAFRRQAELRRTEDIKMWIDEQRLLLVIGNDFDFERKLLAGQQADVQVIADGRNSNTAGTALGYVAAMVERFNADRRAEDGQA